MSVKGLIWAERGRVSPVGRAAGLLAALFDVTDPLLSLPIGPFLLPCGLPSSQGIILTYPL